MKAAKPSDLVNAHLEIGIRDSIAWDTETSGLFADDGARVSTASIAFVDWKEEWEEWASQWTNVTYGLETIVPGYQVYILSCAWPFDQGTEGPPAKVEDTGQAKLWPDTENLEQYEWVSLISLLGEVELDAHNIKFDTEKMRVGVRRWPMLGTDLEANWKWDSQNVNDLLWRLEPTSLKPTCARIFGQEWADEAGVVKKYLARHKLPAGRWDLIPWETISKYADTDARITKMLKLYQQYVIEHGKAGQWLGNSDIVTAMVDRRLDVTKVLYRMERRGIPYDEVTSRMAADECRERAAPIARKLPFLPTPEKAKHYFFGDGVTDKGVRCQNLVPYSVTEKGSPQLTAEIVLRMVDDRVPFAEEWSEWSRVTNAASMWYEGYADSMGTDGRLRTAFRQNGTRSTRFSVERVNLQAIPQDYRLSDHKILDGILTPRQIIALGVPDGWRLYELDLAQAELRVATMFAKCVLMEEMIRDGEDLHAFTTRELFPKIEPDSKAFFQYRQVGKRGNFSLCFGSGGLTFKNMVSKETGIVLALPEADRIVRDWNALYPEFSRAITKHQWKVAKRQHLHGHGWVTLGNGERRWFQEYEEAHKAFNQRVQGNLAQFGQDWMLETESYLGQQTELHTLAAQQGIGEAGLVLTIHDSQVLLLPDDQMGVDFAERCASIGEELWEKWFPDIPGAVDFHAWDRPDV